MTLPLDVHQFFSAVLTNNIEATQALLEQSPALLASQCALGHNAIYYATAYERNELIKCLEEFNTQHQILSPEELREIRSEGYKKASQIADAKILRPLHLVHKRFMRKLDKINERYSKKAEEREKHRQSLQRRKNSLLLAALLSSVLIAFGICSLTLPILISALGASANIVGITTLTLGAMGLIGTLASLAWQWYTEGLEARLNLELRSQKANETILLLQEVPMHKQQLTFAATPTTHPTENNLLADNPETHSAHLNNTSATNNTSHALRHS